MLHVTALQDSYCIFSSIFFSISALQISSYQVVRKTGCFSSSLEGGLSWGWSSKHRRVTSFKPGDRCVGIDGAVVALAIWTRRNNFLEVSDNASSSPSPKTFYKLVISADQLFSIQHVSYCSLKIILLLSVYCPYAYCFLIWLPPDTFREKFSSQQDLAVIISEQATGKTPTAHIWTFFRLLAAFTVNWHETTRREMKLSDVMLQEVTLGLLSCTAFSVFLLLPQR